MRRLYNTKIKHIPSAQWLHDDYVNFMNYPPAKAVGISCHGEVKRNIIDKEAELCAMYTDYVVNITNT